MLETPQKHTKEGTMMELKYERKDDLFFICCACFPSCSGETQHLLFLAFFALHWIPPLLLLLSVLVLISLAKGV